MKTLTDLYTASPIWFLVAGALASAFVALVCAFALVVWWLDSGPIPGAKGEGGPDR